MPIASCPRHPDPDDVQMLSAHLESHDRHN
jgi:hypothetical protein